MKEYTKIVLLVALVLFLSLTACTRQASTPAVTSPTPSGEAPFPFTTPGNVQTFGTQTAIASTPQVLAPTNTPQVIVATATPSGPGGEGAEAGGGQQPAATTAPETAAQAVATPVVARPSSYTLQKGEWPICIARRYDLDIPSFFSANGLNMNSKPAAGKVLSIPASGTWNANYGARSLRQHPTTYTVAAGDSVYSIACRFGDVAPESILAVNNLTSANDVRAGITLQIP